MVFKSAIYVRLCEAKNKRCKPGEIPQFGDNDLIPRVPIALNREINY